MNNGDAPPKFPIPWGFAAGASYIRNIPEASQIGINDGWASLTDGFVPLNMIPLEAGGIPPFGQDMNGILRQITQWSRWAQASGPVIFDADFAADIGGYPKGALLMAATLDHLWLCLADGTATNPDTGGEGWVRWGRIRLFEDTSFYVSTTGSDANDGLSVETPWATVQHAWDVLQSHYDLGGFTAVVRIADGAYTAGLVAEGPIVGASGADSVVFQGNVATRANVTFTATNTVCFYGASQAAFTVTSLKLEGVGAAQGLAAVDGANVAFNDLDFGAFPAGQHISVAGGGVLDALGDYVISGDALNHVSVTAATVRYPAAPQTVTLIDTPAFTDFMIAGTVGAVVGPFNGVTTFTGAATGRRYTVSTNGVINTSGAGDNFLPGNVAGQSLTGGQYA